jgi:4-hydroxy-4-methyl-2-oxoglutarate aldolase
LIPVPVTIYAVPARDLAPTEIDHWRTVPVVVAVDLGRDVGRLNPLASIARRCL